MLIFTEPLLVEGPISDTSPLMWPLPMTFTIQQHSVIIGSRHGNGKEVGIPVVNHVKRVFSKMGPQFF